MYDWRTRGRPQPAYLIAGGTWLMSEPQPATTGFVDLMTLDWPDLEVTPEGLRIGATCTIARLLEWAENDAPAPWTSLALARPAADALLASFKIWNTATVGGNVCQAFAAGAMIAMLSTLDAVALVWTPDGGERRIKCRAQLRDRFGQGIREVLVLSAAEAVPRHDDPASEQRVVVARRERDEDEWRRLLGAGGFRAVSIADGLVQAVPA